MKQAEQTAGRLGILWEEQKQYVARLGKEAPLEEKFIQPVFKELGWKLFYQPQVQGREPDYALFTSDDAYDRAIAVGHRSPEFWSEVSVVADAKAWHIPLDRPNRINGRKEYPPQQMEWYLDRTHVNWGILTNGRLWRLIPRIVPSGKPRFQTYLEVDLPAVLDGLSDPDRRLLTGEHLREFYYFYLLYSPHAFIRRAQIRPLIERAASGSSEYALGVSEDLKERIFEALRLTIAGFLRRPENGLSVDKDLDLCRQNGFILLYRLLFIMYAEDRGLLPYRTNQLYTDNRSLARIRDEVATKLDTRIMQRFSSTETTIWKDMRVLFDLVDSGHGRYGVPAYNGGLFSSESHQFLENNALADSDIAQIIDKLSRARDPQNPDAGLFRVDYRDLAIRQLGSVYEGLLEMHPRFATVRLVVIRSNRPGTVSELYHPANEAIPKGFRQTGETVQPGTVYLESDKGERRATGSYYTPDHIVDYIVQRTLQPVCKRIQDEVEAEIKYMSPNPARTQDVEYASTNLDTATPQNHFDERVLKLRILDPAMGSGHFLVRACQYLAEEIATNPHTRVIDANGQTEEQQTLTYWKRQIAERCLFGVDLNPLAVELAKLALWLETVSKDKPLAFLDNHLRHGNSLIGARLEQLDRLPNAEPLFAGLLASEFNQSKSEMFGPLRDLRLLASDTPATVKEKERLLKVYESRADVFFKVANVWCSELLRVEGTLPIEQAAYTELIQNLRRPRLFRTLLVPYLPQLQRVSEYFAPFHWQLEFPDAFTELADDAQGFHAVIGNPPYDVLASKELGTDLEPMMRFVRHQPEFEPSFVGKNNLYKLFICKAIELLVEGGYLGFIVPMPLLGDEQAVGVRRLILTSGTFLDIHAFPQKDDISKRVFPAAKLSTVLFVMVKSQDGRIKGQRFTVARHPDRQIESGSPSLMMAADEIENYDQTNQTIVSCAQADWDLAVRLMGQSHFMRLGNFCESYQGEVNETNDIRFLSRLPEDGQQVLRGATVCLYALRAASQGESLYIKREAFLDGKAPQSKAWDFQERRVGFQRSAPQNNFRRLIAAPIPRGNFCFDTVSYVPESKSRLPLEMILVLLNSKLLEWYFRLGSSNSKVNEYQFNNLPCPDFGSKRIAGEASLLRDLRRVETSGKWDEFRLIASQAQILRPPFTLTLRDVLGGLATKACHYESIRGSITRRDRAGLSPNAQVIQDVIDHFLFSMAGFTQNEIAALEERMVSLQ
jgi:type I restriction-modification system DNA methylase subunit